MTYPTEITLDFADGRYRFWLPMAQVNELEKTIGMLTLEWHLRQAMGISDTGEAIYTGGTTAEVRGIREVIRLALIGGNRAEVDTETIEVGPTRARELVDAYVFPTRPLAEAAALAWRILAAAIYGNDPSHHSYAPDTPIAEEADA